MKRLPKKTKFLLFFLFFACLLVIFLVARKKFFAPDRRLLDLEREIRSLREKKAFLEKDLREAQTREFIERSARERLNMTYPGETIVVLPQDDQQAVDNRPKESKLSSVSLWQWLKNLVAGEGFEPSASAL